MILADMHENVTCKYVEVNSTGKKYIDRQTQESKASVCPLGGARTTPAAMFLPSLIYNWWRKDVHVDVRNS